MKRWAFLIAFFILLVPYAVAHASCRSVPAGGCSAGEMTCVDPKTNKTVGCCDGTLGPDECMNIYFPNVTNVTNKSNSICDFAGNQKDDCDKCMKNDTASWTAIGCIKSDTSGSFVATFLRFGIGIGGGLAFLLILFGGFQIITAAGNPERMNEGKELISSAIAGLLMIIFSVLILKVIGVNILGIPDFT